MTGVSASPEEATSPTAVPGRAGGVRRRPRVPPAVLVGLVYALGSLALHHRVLGHLTTRLTGWVSSDSSLFVWWLAWTRHSIVTGGNPLYSTWQNAPEGVNAMWNTAVPILGVVLAPLTAAVGPVATYNVAVILGPVVSGLACYAALRVLDLPWWSRGLAGGLYAACPFMIAHLAVGHLNLAWDVLPPVVLWFGVRVLAAPSRPWLAGAALGLALAVQTGLYTQTVALTAVALLVVAVVLAARWPGRVRERVPAVARALLACLAVYVPVCAYPLWLVVAGPGRPRAPVRDATTTGADAANLVVPTSLTEVHGWSGLAESMRGYAGEQGSYVGVALLLVVLLAVVTARAPAARLVATVTAVLWVLSLGTSLVVLGRDTGVRLPWSALLALPLVSEAEAGRLAPFVAMGVVTLVAMVVADAVRSRRFVTLGLVLLAACTWIPSDSQQSTPVTVPAFFSSPAFSGTGAPGLLGGETVEVVPRPSGAWVGGADPLLWQAESGFAFRQTGGYFIGEDAEHPLLLEGVVSEYQRGLVADGDPALARRELRERGVSAVVVVPTPGQDPARVLGWTRTVTGDPGRETGGVVLFRF